MTKHWPLDCDVVPKFDPGRWWQLTLTPVEWCGKPAVHSFVDKGGQIHGICQDHLDLMYDGTQVTGLDVGR